MTNNNDKKTNQTWGGRFKKPLDPIVAKFNASLPFDHVLFAHDIKGSLAHAKMLARQCIITQEDADSICNALQEIHVEFQQGKHILDNDCEDIHMFIEQILVKKTGDVGKKLHTGRSRNDQVALDLRLYARDIGIEVSELLNALIQTLKSLSDKHKNDLMPGYTHLQQAQPITLGKYFEAYISMFKRDLDRLANWSERMNLSPLGACALAGSNLPLDRKWVAKELGFSDIIENTIDAVSDRDFVMEFCSMASIMMVHLSRLSEDIILWATTEFNFVTLDDAFSTGSSLMPNKKNPDVLELIRGKSGRVFGNLIGILTVMKALPLAYNKDMQEDKEIFFNSSSTLISCLEVIAPFLKSLSFNTELMLKKANEGHLNATALVEKLVLEGIPFRDAHHIVGELVLKCIEKGIGLEDELKSK